MTELADRAGPPRLGENPYRAALVDARAEVLRVEAAVRAALARPRGLLAPSWRCAAADEFAAGLLGAERTMLRAIEASLAELDAKIREQPELITTEDWQFQWRSTLDAPTNPLRGHR